LGAACKTCLDFCSKSTRSASTLFLHQQGLDTRTPAGKAMFGMMGVFAEFERSVIAEREPRKLQG
jgi:DNA invertase Pin-like site-specific DNA recombinase